MCSMNMMSALVIGQFSNILFSTYLMFSTMTAYDVLYGPGFMCIRILLNYVFIFRAIYCVN